MMPFNDMEKTEMICTEEDASGLDPRKNVEELECSKIVGKENIKNEKNNSATAGAKNKAEGGRKKNRMRPRKSSSTPTETHKKRKSGGDDKVRSASTTDGLGVPRPVYKPKKQPLADTVSLEDLVFFDIVTTGFIVLRDEIVEIRAVGPSGTFQCYVTPDVPIHVKATEKHGISLLGDGQMYRHGTPVKSVPIGKALTDFMAFLGKGAVLAGYSADQFDALCLVKAALNCDKLKLTDHMVGFVDILKMLKISYPDIKAHNQLFTYKYFVGKEPSDRGEDRNALSPFEIRELYNKAKASDIRRFTFDLMYCEESLRFREQKADNLETWSDLITRGYISKGRAECAAASGLRLEHLARAHKLGGREAVEMVLTEKGEDGKCRVMQWQKCIQKFLDYFT